MPSWTLVKPPGLLQPFTTAGAPAAHGWSRESPPGDQPGLPCTAQARDSHACSHGRLGKSEGRSGLARQLIRGLSGRGRGNALLRWTRGAREPLEDGPLFPPGRLASPSNSPRLAWARLASTPAAQEDTGGTQRLRPPHLDTEGREGETQRLPPQPLRRQSV